SSSSGIVQLKQPRPFSKIEMARRNQAGQEYPRVSRDVPQRRGLREPDAILGGTWETFERVMQNHGYFKEGLPKIDTARRIAARIIPDQNRSPSFQAFHAALMEALS
ncbi:DUF4276 family protein, partial [Burkholderia pseudomallei]|uniref:DUF4276 family protein n=2 Tax=Burkholderia pseudomallei TaxID=28450 RepID=UPI000F078C17